MYYVRNNVEYRIASCQKIEQFKGSQAFVLSEIISGKHVFAECSKEVLYLLYENMFKWLLFVERFLIDNKYEVSDWIVRVASEEALSYYETVARVIRLNPDIFDPSFTKSFLESNFFTFDYFRLGLQAGTSVHSIDYFSTCADALMSFLNSTLFVLHEIDTIAFNKHTEPFICVDDSHFYYESCGIFPELERFRVYSKIYGIKNRVHLKIYLKEVPDGMERQLTTMFKKEGIEILSVL